MRSVRHGGNAESPHDCHAQSQVQITDFCLWPNESEMPALRIGDQEVSEDLDARDRLEFFWINKIGVKRERVGLAKQLHQTAIFLDQIVRQHGDAEPALARAQDAEHIVYRQLRCARAFAVPAYFQKPAPVLQCAGTTWPPSRIMRCLSSSS